MFPPSDPQAMFGWLQASHTPPAKSGAEKQKWPGEGQIVKLPHLGMA